MLTGVSVDVLCELNPEHKQLVAIENGVKVLYYVRLIKAIYGCVKLALLWYHRIEIEADGFRFETM